MTLPISKLIKFHSLLFLQTFSEQVFFRVHIPDGVLREERLSILTSAGYEEKTTFIDRNCTEISELIMWRKYIKPLVPFEKVEKYICIKSYFKILHEIYSERDNCSKNHENINFLIGRLKIWIQKDKIDDVASVFHFFSLALFPRQKSTNNHSTLSKNFVRDSKSFFGSRTI